VYRGFEHLLTAQVIAYDILHSLHGLPCIIREVFEQLDGHLPCLIGGLVDAAFEVSAGSGDRDSFAVPRPSPYSPKPLNPLSDRWKCSQHYQREFCPIIGPQTHGKIDRKVPLCGTRWFYVVLRSCSGSVHISSATMHSTYREIYVVHRQTLKMPHIDSESR
jgi:hypothetical protein